MSFLFKILFSNLDAFQSFKVCKDLLTVCLSISASTLCCVWWCRHWCTDAWPWPRLPLASSHTWSSSGHDGTWEDWSGTLQVRIQICYKKNWILQFSFINTTAYWSMIIWNAIVNSCSKIFKQCFLKNFRKQVQIYTFFMYFLF